MKGAVITPAFSCHVCLKIGRGGFASFCSVIILSIYKKNLCAGIGLG